MLTRASSGQRNCMVTIQARPDEDAVDTSGFPTEQWATLYPLVAMSREDIVSQSRGQEHFVAGQLSGAKLTRWEMDYAPDMDPDVHDVPKFRRLLYLGRVHDIIDAALIGQRRAVELRTTSAKRVVS